MLWLLRDRRQFRGFNVCIFVSVHRYFTKIRPDTSSVPLWPKTLPSSQNRYAITPFWIANAKENFKICSRLHLRNSLSSRLSLLLSGIQPFVNIRDFNLISTVSDGSSGIRKYIALCYIPLLVKTTHSFGWGKKDMFKVRHCLNPSSWPGRGSEPNWSATTCGLPNPLLLECDSCYLASCP